MSQLLKGVNRLARAIRGARLPQRWHVFAVVALALAFFLAGMNRAPVPTVDGAVRASMARNIVTQQQLWPITYEGRVFTDHPPLFLWFTALSYKIFGINDFAANLPSRLFAFLTVLVTAAIAVEAGLSLGTATLAALILCLTRDFVLSSVRGYIEPMLEFFVYLGLWFVLHQKRKRNYWAAAAAGAAVWLATFSKGPVALWPFLFFIVMLLWNGQTGRRRAQLVTVYLLMFGACTLVWAMWVDHNNHWEHWKNYFFGQVLSSALEGRGGAQQIEPFYFLEVLAKYYWPWLPLLLLSLYRLARNAFQLNFSSQASYAVVFALFGLGFVGGFSLMKWKFWYYIAPAYPAFALLIATSFHEFTRRWVDSPAFPRHLSYAAAVWIAIVSIFPIQLHKERVPEVQAFKSAITGSPIPGPVWFIRSPVDHNMIGTSGEWYFRKTVTKVEPEKENEWEKTKLSAPAWIITGTEQWAKCQAAWCQRSILIQSTERSALVLFTN